MIVILNTRTGEAYNFKTRKEAAKFLHVSAPTLRGWIRSPFFLYQTLIITCTSDEKVKKSKALLQFLWDGPRMGKTAADVVPDPGSNGRHINKHEKVIK